MPELSFLVERFATPTGAMILLTDALGQVRALDWEDHEARMTRLLRLNYPAAEARLMPHSGPSAARRALEAYFAGDLAATDGLRVKTGGTDFQREVWAALRRIPVGQTTTYGRLAASLGRPKATRAVGLANGGNPIAVIVPCHRVIGANGSLTGFGGGIARKRWLLAHESAEISDKAPETRDFAELWDERRP